MAALSLPLFIPVLAAGIRLRPALRFPAGVGPRLRSLALAGIWALLAQQAAVVTTLTLGTRVGGQGAPVVVQYAQAVYLLPYAVLAVPIATAVFPRLSHAVAQGRTGAFADAAARTTRTVVTVSLLGSAVLAGAAPAVQALFTALDADAGGPASAVLGEGITWFAAGLAGWGLVAHVSRVLFALGRERAAAGATAAGWATVAAASVLVVLGLRAAGTSPERAAVVGIGAGTTAGLLLAGALLLVALRRAAGPRAVRGVGWTLASGASAAVAGALLARLLLPVPHGAAGALGVGIAAGLAAAAGFAAVAGLGAWYGEPRRNAGGTPPGGGVPGLVPRIALVLASSGGGVGRHVAALARDLHRAGVPVTVAGPSATHAAFDLVATGATVEAVEIADRPRPGSDLRALAALRELADRVDVVHAHGLRAGALAVLAARSRRVRPRVVVTLHNALVGGRRIAAVHKVLAGIVARGADTVLVVSPDLGDTMRALGARQVERALGPRAGAIR